MLSCYSKILINLYFIFYNLYNYQYNSKILFSKLYLKIKYKGEYLI